MSLAARFTRVRAHQQLSAGMPNLSKGFWRPAWPDDESWWIVLPGFWHWITHKRHKKSGIISGGHRWAQLRAAFNRVGGQCARRLSAERSERWCGQSCLPMANYHPEYPRISQNMTMPYYATTVQLQGGLWLMVFKVSEPGLQQPSCPHHCSTQNCQKPKCGRVAVKKCQKEMFTLLGAFPTLMSRKASDFHWPGSWLLNSQFFESLRPITCWAFSRMLNLLQKRWGPLASRQC